MAVVPTEAKNIADVAARVREVLLLGTAALEQSTAFATAAQGLLADSALQPAAIGVTVQAYDADLTAIAALTSAADKAPYATGAGTWAMMDVTAAGRALLDDANAAAQRTTLELGTAATADVTAFATAAQGATADSALQPSMIGVTVQAYDADLTAIAALVSAADKAPYATGAGTWAMMDVTAAGRALLDDANAAAQRTTLELGSMATQSASSVAITGGSATFTTGLSLSGANAIAYLNKAVSGGVTAINGLVNGVNRWSLELGNSEGESGGNAGSNASLSRFSDAGAWLGFVFTISRATGDITLGSGLVFTTFGGYAAIQPTDRLILRDSAPALTDVYNVGVLRNASGLTGGTAGFVNSALRVETTVDAVASYEWAFLSTITVNGAGGGEHVAGYLQAVKNANNTVWSACTELRDWVANPTTGSVGIEVGIFVSGTDASEMRHGIDISIGSANNGTGTNIVSSGVRIGPSLGDPARAQFTNGVQISGKGVCGLNLFGMDVSYADRLIRLPENAIISWRNQGTNVESAALAWNATIATWQRSGMLLTTAAPTGGTAGALPAQPVGYINEQINGTMRKIPYYH